MSIATDTVREIEDLLPAELVVLAIHQFADEVLAPAEAVRAAVTELTVPAGQKLYKFAATICAELPSALRLDKVGFARAALDVLERDATPELRAAVLKNFEQLFALVARAQRDAVRKNGRERMHRTVSRFRNGFLRDHQKTASRREVNKLLEDIESQLTEVTDETESMRSAIRLIRADFKLTEEPGAPVDDFEALVERLAHLTYEGVRAAQV